MMNNFRLDDAVKDIKNIVENNRCVNCDQLNALSVRYPCGHTTCNNCVATAEDCLLCLTPPEVSTHYIDEPSSLRVKHASELLTAFQELFEVDVYKRHRLSEKLKIEKQLFPECIQVSSKYTNKRKSFENKGLRKRNKKLASFPGENISFRKSYTMENIENNVEQWLNKNETFQKNVNSVPRKPFTNLNINVQKHKDNNKLVNQTSNKSLSRKRSHLNILKDTSNVSKVPYKKFKTQSEHKERERYFENNLIENNESGIFIEDAIIIDDSQSAVLDKDHLALMAVLEADKNDLSTDCGIDISMTESIKKNCINSQNNSQGMINTYKVPFVKKSAILEICKLCRDANERDNSQIPKNVTVTIDNDRFITTIKVVDCSDSVKYSTKFAAVQTDDEITKVDMKNIELHPSNESPNTSFCEVKLTPQETKHDIDPMQDKDLGNKSKCLIIEESDSDSDFSNIEGCSFEVIAECHNTEKKIHYDVLGELKLNDYENRGRHALREHSPHSTDSSDKENYDPNKMKRPDAKKKCCYKNKR
ncbi:uncharacterized protein LOC116768647 [Danaus plexippus]|uniref:uncharacterized protein LOC116768647 n=1 Tax=Danaus plexippus TaxID=13037 RepID=UPI002AB248D6|nr:uncharacterized protein LOC116768647 [Danaus plexippus]